MLSDQQGEYVYVVAADNKAELRRIKLGQSTPTIAAVTSGISLGEKVIVEGLQRFLTWPGRRAWANKRADPVEHECQPEDGSAQKAVGDRAEAGGDHP